MYTHHKQIITSGIALAEAERAIIMLHGRGSSAENMIMLARRLKVDDMAVITPQATNHSWYPYSFLAPAADNQPALDSALSLLEELVADISQVIAMDRIWFLGFSQGACLALEYAARNARRYGGVIAFTGGLIGEDLIRGNYTGNFSQTPILLTTGDPDAHVPLTRVEESASILKEMGAEVTVTVYKNRPHIIQEEEINLANRLFLK